jgi:hypothetical protein
MKQTVEMQEAAIEAIRTHIDKAGEDRGFAMASHKFVGSSIEIGVKPTGKTALAKWRFVQVDVKDKTVGDIGREAAFECALWADRELNRGLVGLNAILRQEHEKTH